MSFEDWEEDVFGESPSGMSKEQKRYLFYIAVITGILGLQFFIWYIFASILCH